MREMKELGRHACSTAPKVTFEVFENDEGAIELARFPKTRPRTKQINQMCNHFRSYASNDDVETFTIDTKVQIENTVTKPLPKEQFQKLRLKLIHF